MGRRGHTRKESHWHDGQPSGYDWIGRSTRLAIYMRDGFKCLACAMRGGPNPFVWSGLTLDHLDTSNRGADASNLVTLCLSCNSSRRATDPAKWDAVFAEVAYFRPRLFREREGRFAIERQAHLARYAKDAARSKSNREKRAQSRAKAAA